MRNPKWFGVGSKFAHLTSVHPCFGIKTYHKVARIHLPVAPLCNIQCNYCTRALNKCEWRPGVASCIMNLEEAIKKIESEVKTNPKLKVIGIAGPGESLYNKLTFDVLFVVKERWNWLIRCISTNGLLIEDKIEELVKLDLNSVTITINAIAPEIGAKIYEWINYNGRIIEGIEGARILIDKQLRGIEALVDKGIIVKVNTVLIPGINMNEIEKIASEVAKRGAKLMNIIPLIPLYKFKDIRGPTCEELERARKIAENYIPQFRFCKLCRSDAYGTLGSTYFHG